MPCIGDRKKVVNHSSWTPGPGAITVVASWSAGLMITKGHMKPTSRVSSMASQSPRPEWIAKVAAKPMALICRQTYDGAQHSNRPDQWSSKEATEEDQRRQTQHWTSEAAEFEQRVSKIWIDTNVTINSNINLELGFIYIKANFNEYKTNINLDCIIDIDDKYKLSCNKIKIMFLVSKTITHESFAIHLHHNETKLCYINSFSRIEICIKSDDKRDDRLYRNEYLQNKECQNTVEKLKNEIKEYVNQYKW
jgi:hypothetical protein